MRAGDHERACPKLEQSSALVAGVGIQFNLAQCLEQLGERKRAHELYLDVADKLAARGDSEREAVARQRAAALDPPPQPAAPEVAAPAAAPAADEPAAPPRKLPPVELPDELKPADPADEQFRHRAVGWGLLIGGSLAAAVGYGTFGAGVGAQSKAEACGSDGSCSEAEAAARSDDAIAMQQAGLPLAILGTTGLLAGVITLAVADDGEGAQPAPAVQLAAGPNGGRVGVRVHW